MHKQLFTKHITAFIFCVFLFTTSIAQSQQVLPSKSQLEWAECEIGVIIHLDINIYAPDTFRYENKQTLPPLSVFNPAKLSTDQWIESAKKAGAKYAVLTAKHGTGFCLWPTKAHDYHVGNTPFRGGNADLVADFIASCKKYGIKPGIYYNTNINSYYGAGYVPLTDDQKLAYNEVVYSQLAELWGNYGNLFEIWFDGGVMTDSKTGIADRVMELLGKHQSDAILFQGPTSSKNVIRWVGNEDGRALNPNWSRTSDPDGKEGWQGNPDGKFWMPAESDFPNRKKSAWNGGWLWHAGEESHLFNVTELVDRYYTSVGHNSNMLIGMVIDTDGQFPKADAKVFEEFGKAINKRFSNKLGSVNGRVSTLTLPISREGVKANQVVIQENIAKGENIRKYIIEAQVAGEWQEVCGGESIGYKRIHTFETKTINQIRIRVTEADGEVDIKNFSAYHFR